MRFEFAGDFLCSGVVVQRHSVVLHNAITCGGGEIWIVSIISIDFTYQVYGIYRLLSLHCNQTAHLADPAYSHFCPTFPSLPQIEGAFSYLVLWWDQASWEVMAKFPCVQITYTLHSQYTRRSAPSLFHLPCSPTARLNIPKSPSLKRKHVLYQEVLP